MEGLRALERDDFSDSKLKTNTESETLNSSGPESHRILNME
ncbi:hypothetical protein chiPu_0018679, partial [Chiloscyllium punctatum]|nr:hypothetical protein [Chiloscyllium punctatum]